jgi:hypothetical protein
MIVKRILLWVIVGILVIGSAGCEKQAPDIDNDKVQITSTPTLEDSSDSNVADEKPPTKVVTDEESPVIEPEGVDSLDGFENQVKQAVTEGDNTAMVALMAEEFGFGLWQSEGYSRMPDEAVVELNNNFIGAGVSVFSSPPDLSYFLPDGDVLKVWDPSVNPVRAVFVSGWGATGNGEAFLILAEPESGTYQWAGLLFAPEGFVQDKALVSFEMQLMDAVTLGDFDTMAELMSDPFSFVFWRSEGYSKPVQDALAELQSDFLDDGFIDLAVPPDLSDDIPGDNVLNVWDPSANPVRALFTSGWGLDGEGEAYLIIVEPEDGNYRWAGLLYAYDGFTP